MGISLCKLHISLEIFLFNSKTIKQDNFVYLDCSHTHFAYKFCVTKSDIFLPLIALNISIIVITLTVGHLPFVTLHFIGQFEAVPHPHLCLYKIPACQDMILDSNTYCREFCLMSYCNL